MSEVSALAYAVALAALHWLVAQAHAQQLPGVRLNIATSSSLARLARSLGVRNLGAYAWQVHIPDPAALLRVLAPTLTVCPCPGTLSNPQAFQPTRGVHTR